MDEVEIEAVETLSDRWRPLREYRLRQRRRDGTRQELVREVYAMGPAAAVLPHDPQRGTVLLIRQFRLPALLNGDAPRLVEACAGLVEPGDDAATTIRKEAEQELGCSLAALREVMLVYSSPGVVAEKVHLFAATYDPSRRNGHGGGLAEEGEEIEVLELPLAEAWAMIGRREIIDAKTVLLLQHLRLEGAR
jgi:nudix-type nucleoside diphosphatase (YffH/AdpP family)